MLNNVMALALGLVIGLLLGLVYVLIWKARPTGAIRQDAIQRSLAVTIGKVSEQLVPYLPDFPFNPKDARFLGSPVDLVVFDGMDEGQVRRVVFMALVESIALRKLGTPDDIAWGVLFFASEFAGWITGQVLSIDGGR